MIDIFVSKEIAQKLREIGFDEPYIAFYYYKRLILTRKKATDIAESNDIIKAPTWEQVFKWFRERNSLGYIKYYSDVEMYACFIYLKNKAYWPEIIGFYETYEESRNVLILKLIELYQNN